MYKKKFLVLLFTLLISTYGNLFAESDPLRPGHPDSYVVVEGDTLWDISARFLTDAWRWPNIWYANPQVENPHLIYPGDTLQLVYIDGKPRIMVQRGRQTVKLSPQGRITKLNKAIPTIPLDAIAPFLTKPEIVSQEALDSAPYILGNKGEHLATAKRDKIYVRGITDAERGQGYSIVRRGEKYVDPKSGDVLGFEATYVGESVLKLNGDPASLIVAQANREVLSGDLLLPSSDTTYESHFFPHAPDTEVEGQILSVMDGVSQVGLYNVVVINLGTKDGIKSGHVLDIYQAGETVKDHYSGKRDSVKLPDERAGVLMVFRTFDRLSYALVMYAERNMHVLDMVRTPQY
ncbi:MAG TPA: LysM domain-containing protein [Gammaproteobacteria bacterium]|mgnify:CR=1 FL=1|nr:LysM domain-containing protein [Gammaproteobacteria bacterium]